MYSFLGSVVQKSKNVLTNPSSSQVADLDRALLN